MNQTNPKVLVVCGPTASGKTAFAIEVAKLLPKANILSVDSRQVYKDLDVITGKDIPENLPETIHFFGLNIFNVADSGNLADFLKYSQKVILDSLETNTSLIIVGGTGLYLKALTHNLSDATIPQDLILRTELEQLSLPELQERLCEINPDKYQSLNNSDVHNPRRLIRAIEISSFQNRQPSTQASNVSAIPSIDYLRIGFMPDKADISNSIHKRVIERLEFGAIDEVKRLLQKNPDTSLPIYTSLGVSQILSYLEDKISLTELEEIWSKAEIDYARRQIVWFKKQPGIIWYDKTSNKKILALELAKKLSNTHEQ